MSLQVREGASYTQETRKIILSLERIRKVAPNGKEVLNNVSLGEWLAHLWRVWGRVRGSPTRVRASQVASPPEHGLSLFTAPAAWLYMFEAAASYVRVCVKQHDFASHTQTHWALMMVLC